MPRLALLATGGTIAGSGSQTAYRAGVLDARTLVEAVPRLGELAQWQIEQAFALDSRDLTPAHWLELAARVRALQADPAIDGIVITHGTDTLEETALALHLLLGNAGCVVLTAAMRPATSASADGPLNLIQAACVAGAGAGRGVLVVADGRILAADAIVKTHTHAVDALQPRPDRAATGSVLGEAVHFGGPAPAPRAALLRADAPLPRVDILYASAGAPDDLIDACVRAGARGLVLALTGHGSVPAAWREALARARAAGVSLVRASRVGAGGVWPDCNEDDEAAGTIAACHATPQQARVLLMLALAARPVPARNDLVALFAGLPC
ncbi:MAG: asparaginase [Candidatus Dactylopiibacterium sp.]|nr:asparaginase [Candidatus Dactylopiibacterium sp.]